MKPKSAILKATCSEHAVEIIRANERRGIPIDYRDFAFTPEISQGPRRSHAKAGANARTRGPIPITNGVLPKTFKLKS